MLVVTFIHGATEFFDLSLENVATEKMCMCIYVSWGSVCMCVTGRRKEGQSENEASQFFL